MFLNPVHIWFFVFFNKHLILMLVDFLELSKFQIYVASRKEPHQVYTQSVWTCVSQAGPYNKLFLKQKGVSKAWQCYAKKIPPPPGDAQGFESAVWKKLSGSRLVSEKTILLVWYSHAVYVDPWRLLLSIQPEKKLCCLLTALEYTSIFNQFCTGYWCGYRPKFKVLIWDL